MPNPITDEMDDLRAAIVCYEVAVGGSPILVALRDEPLEDADSGWQFLCGVNENEDLNNAQTWGVVEVLRHEPSLEKFIKLPPGSKISRTNVGSEWRVQ